MLQFALCDDNRLQIELWEDFFKEYNKTHTENINIRCFFSGEELLGGIKNVDDVDVFILDLIMPGMNGIKVAERLRARNFRGKILFLTASEDYAIDAFSVQAYDYILKPMDFGVMFKKIERIQREFDEQAGHSITINIQEGKRIVRMRDVLYIRGDNRVVLYYLTDGQKLTGAAERSSFRNKIEEFLADGTFALCSSVAAANLAHVRSFLNMVIAFDNGIELECTRTMVRSFRTSLNKYWGVKEE